MYWSSENGHTLESNRLLGGVDFLCFGLVDGDLSLLVPSDISSGLNDTSGFEGSDSDRR
jgi:hypothetical protein